MGYWSNFIAGLTAANIISGRKNTALNLRNVLGGIQDAIGFLEGLSRGAKILHGPAGPDAANGLNGDAYLDTTAGDLYLKENDDWGLRVVLRGAPGRNGTNGTNGRTPVLGVDYTLTNGTNGKSAYEIWVANGNVGNQAQYLESLKGQNGTSGNRITANASAPTAPTDLGAAADSETVGAGVSFDNRAAGDLHFQTISAERFRLWWNDRGNWVVLYTTPAGATVADGSVTNAKLADDVKAGSLSAARIAFPLADRLNLNSFTDMVAWCASGITNTINGLAALTTRVKTLEDRPTTVTTTAPSGSGSTNGVTLTSAGDGTKYLANDGTYKAIQAGAATVAVEQNLTSNSATAAPSVSAVRAALDLAALSSRQPFQVTQTTGRLPLAGFFKGVRPVFSNLIYNYDIASVAFYIQYYDGNGDLTEAGPYAQFAGSSGLNTAIVALSQSIVDNGFSCYGLFVLKPGRSSAVGYFDISSY